MDNEYSADFIRYYKDRSEDGSSYQELWQLNKQYDAIDGKLASQHGMRIQDYELKLTGDSKDKTFDATNSREALRQTYKTRADAIARKHGFKGKSYDQHMREQDKQKGQIQGGKPDDKKPQQHSPSGGKQAETKTPSKEAQRQAFMQQMRDAGNNLTKGKDRER